MNSDTGIWMPVYFSDYAKETSRLRFHQHGAYFLLMQQYWINDGPLPDDKEGLYYSTSAISLEDKKTIDFILENFFQYKDGFFINSGLDAKLAEAKENRRIQVNRTAKATEARRLKRNVMNNVTSDVANNVTTNVTSNVALTSTPSSSPSPTNISEPPTIDKPKENIKTPFIPLEGKEGFKNQKWDVLKHLSEDGLKQAKSAAIGWDIYNLANIYNAGFEKRGVPNDVDLAFPAWCRKYTKDKQL